MQKKHLLKNVFTQTLALQSFLEVTQMQSNIWPQQYYVVSFINNYKILLTKCIMCFFNYIQSNEYPVSNFIDLSLTISCKLHVFDSLKMNWLSRIISLGIGIAVCI